jgi:hypothetical protein
MYQAFIVSYAPFLFTTPFLLLSMCLSLVCIHFYQEQIQQAAGLTPPYPKPEFRKELFLILGELHEQVEPVAATHPKWLNIPERGLFTGIAALGAIGSGKTRELILPAMRQLFGYEAQDSEKKLSGIVLEVKGDLCRHLRRITDATLQYRAHSLLVQPFITFAVEHFFSDELGEPPDLEWFHHEGCDRAKLGRKVSENVFRIQTNQKSTPPLPLHARH